MTRTGCCEKLWTLFRANTPRSKKRLCFTLVELLDGWDSHRDWIKKCYLDIQAIGMALDWLPSKPQLKPDLSVSCKTGGEKAYMRAMFTRPCRLKVPGGPDLMIKWGELEVPPGLHAPRGKLVLRLDLLGTVLPAENEYLLAELKAGPKAESPFHALYQAVLYALTAEACKDRLKTRPGAPHNNSKYWDRFECRHLAVAGDEDYWATWKDHLPKVREVGRWIQDKHKWKVHLCKFTNVDFTEQARKSKNGKTYLPSWPSEGAVIWQVP